MKEHAKLCLNYFASAPWTTWFVDGNHECFTELYQYPVKSWCGGRVHVIRPHVCHLMRGDLLTISGKTLKASNMSIIFSLIVHPLIWKNSTFIAAAAD